MLGWLSACVDKREIGKNRSSYVDKGLLKMCYCEALDLGGGPLDVAQ